MGSNPTLTATAPISALIVKRFFNFLKSTHTSTHARLGASPKGDAGRSSVVYPVPEIRFVKFPEFDCANSEGQTMYLEPYINKIEALLESEGESDLIYAALECRLALERICYELLKLNLDYVGAETLSKWQPKHLINSLRDHVDPKITSGRTISMGKKPVSDEDLTLDQFKQAEYIELGKTAGIDISEIHSLWNALGSYLHTRMPRKQGEDIARYPINDKTKSKIADALKSIKSYQENTTIQMSSVGESTLFKCVCGTVNRRMVKVIESKPILQCINPSCDVGWKIEKSDNGEYMWERDAVAVQCMNNDCNAVSYYDSGVIQKFEKGRDYKWTCATCGEVSLTAWRLYGAAKPKK